MKIAAAAIKFRGKVYHLPAPNRHHHIIAYIRNLHETAVTQEVQGFLTNSGKFLDRKEAARIAIAAGQIKALRWPPNLYSEDLW